MDSAEIISNSRGAKAPGPDRPAASKNLSKLTPGERLWLWRRTAASQVESRRGVSVHGEGRALNSKRSIPRSQLEAAVFLGLEASTYWAAEHDLLPQNKMLEMLGKIEEPSRTLADYLRVARRRSVLSLSQVAVGAGVGSRPTFYKLEAAGDQRIVRFWCGEGFKFPRKIL